MKTKLWVKKNYNLNPTSKYKCKINNFSNPLRGISCKTKSHYSPCRVTTIIQQTLVKIDPKKIAVTLLDIAFKMLTQ